MEEEQPEETTVPEPIEPVVIKKRGRPKGSLNKKTLDKRKGAPEPAPASPPALTLDVDFTSEEVLGDPAPKRKAKRPKPPTPPPSSESEEEPPPPPSRLKRQRTRRAPRSEPQPLLNPPSYLEVLQRGLKEARAKQHAEKVAQYDRFFQW